MRPVRVTPVSAASIKSFVQSVGQQRFMYDIYESSALLHAVDVVSVPSAPSVRLVWANASAQMVRLQLSASVTHDTASAVTRLTVLLANHSAAEFAPLELALSTSSAVSGALSSSAVHLRSTDWCSSNIYQPASPPAASARPLRTGPAPTCGRSPSIRQPLPAVWWPSVVLSASLSKTKLFLAHCY